MTTPDTRSPSAPSETAKKKSFWPPLYFPDFRVVALILEVFPAPRAEPVLFVRLELHVAQPVEELEGGDHREDDARPRVNEPAEREAPEEVRHPAEKGRPDRHPGEHRDEEAERDAPVDEARREAVPDDLVSDGDVFTIPGDGYRR